MWAVIIATHKEACSHTFMGPLTPHTYVNLWHSNHTHTKSHPFTHLRPCRRNACSLLLNVTVLCCHSDMHLCIGQSWSKADTNRILNAIHSPSTWVPNSAGCVPPSPPALSLTLPHCMTYLCPGSPSGSKPASSEWRKALVASHWRKQHGMGSAWRTPWGDTTVCTTEYHRQQVELTNI